MRFVGLEPLVRSESAVRFEIGIQRRNVPAFVPLPGADVPAYAVRGNVETVPWSVSWSVRRLRAGITSTRAAVRSVTPYGLKVAS